jgi:hypothetical protein
MIQCQQTVIRMSMTILLQADDLCQTKCLVAPGRCSSEVALVDRPACLVWHHSQPDHTYKLLVVKLGISVASEIGMDWRKLENDMI